MKVDIVEKHVGKVYDKEIVNVENKSTARWKYLSQCQHLQFAEQYNKFLINKKKTQGKWRNHHISIWKDDGNKFVIKDDTIKHCISHPI